MGFSESIMGFSGQWDSLLRIKFALLIPKDWALPYPHF